MTRSIFLLQLLALLSYFFDSEVRALDSEAIVGGDYAEDDQFKYQISLELNGNFLCGGAIIADNFVLTAAHCVLTPLGTIYDLPFKVVAGTIDLNTKKGAVQVDVETVYVHEKSNRAELINDIAILKLKENLGLDKNSHLHKVNLAADDDTYVGKVATVSGYGYSIIKTFINPWTKKLDENGYTDKLLKYGKVKIIDNDECQRKVVDFNPRDTNICGYMIQRGNRPEGVCSGDSGGPLVYNNTVIGIVSNSPLGCREDKAPAVYTRVSSYTSMIRSILEGHPINVKQLTIGIDQLPIFPQI